MAIARDMLSQARSGHGAILVVEGPAGIGKSSVLDAIAAGTERFQIARARPVELEREHAFGVVRTLFEPLLPSLSEASASALAAGPGAAARRILEDSDRAAGTTQSTFFGLFWLLALATNDAPVLRVIDDAQWADPPSLAWLTYIARRLPDLAAVVLCATRPESSSDAVDELLSAKDAVTVRPLTPLGAASVRTMIERSLGRRDAIERTADVMAATRGNPFLVTELLRTWRDS